MKIYRVHFRDVFDESKGYEYYRTRRAAEIANRSNDKKHQKDTLEVLEFKPTKKEIMKLLFLCGSHPDNG